ncbi:hypothetical protein PRIPAC_76162 [Pristionchus pacificus]|uniref:Uncharacterized protein n=1 Tax=Pristionchus pacificus TaxID=54126 RepID=A0A2A6D008_PRIPA|nr:hypothetical protein PRIPAC_76162 [Pristionchus pacificus]|eukprot:PDM83812.1 hypothetical protein PRIPAC_30299 [Pristionchus pacificus]
MKWCCFLFWFVWRLTLACLAHFNWGMALYTNCIYFVIWKTYDILWFWMHLILCSCFESLRRENYLLVWCNLIRHRKFKYPNTTYKQIYLTVYGGKGTKAERALEGLEDKELKEKLSRRETRRIKESRGEDLSSSSDDDDNQMVFDDRKKKFVHNATELAEREADKYLYIGHAVPSGNSLARLAEEGTNEEGTELEEVDPRENDGEEETNIDEGTPLHRRAGMKKEREKRVRGDIIITDPIETVSVNSNDTRWQRMKNFFPRHFPTFNRQYSTGDPNSVDVISANYRNTYDLADPKDEKRREKRDRKIADSIELFLQFLRMICSFAMIIGNIRRTYKFAQFRYLHKGQKSSDLEYLLTLQQTTVFIDCSMFWINSFWAACLQWHLCCRLGLMRFLLWSSFLGFIAFVVMFLPVSIASNQLDPSWCHFGPHEYLYQFQPKWNW